MQYFYKAQCHCIDDSSIHVESEGDRSRTGHFYFRVERFINRGKYTYYYYPLDGALLMCLFFNLNLDDLDAAYEKNKEYFPFATKTWSLLCNAYLRGKNGDFSNPFIYKFRDFSGGDNRTYAWLLCQKVPYISPSEINSKEQYELACNLIHYANDMLYQFINNDVSKIDKIKINTIYALRTFAKKLTLAIVKENI